jgi:signal transduction histidine kinase
VINLLSNAIKYGEGSPIEITIDAPTPDSAVLQVRDSGIGISAELKARIFERFERGVNPSRLTGLGLGLYITRQIVEAHEGKIEVESEVGKGSVFIVRLPTQIFKSESYDQSTK